MTAAPLSEAVAGAFARYPAPVRAQLLDIREMIFVVARETEGVGTLTEAVKWGEPAYLTEESRSGTTIRLGVSRLAPQNAAIFFNCKTTLVETFRTHFGEVFDFEANRALILPSSAQLPEEPLVLCLRAALTYHRQKRVGQRP
ncbi:DUF1801 domain-containing protein [Rhizobiaceae sp. 2RAB30]